MCGKAGRSPLISFKNYTLVPSSGGGIVKAGAPLSLGNSLGGRKSRQSSEAERTGSVPA